LIQLIRSALSIEPNAIRCTSVPGYKLQVGTDTNAQLKEEIFGAKIFIGLISPTSIQSTYVLFELGARWGSDLPLFPILTTQISADLLKGPLAGINALSCQSEDDLFQLIQDLSNSLSRPVPLLSVYKDQVKALAKMALESRMPDSTLEEAVTNIQSAPLGVDISSDLDMIIKKEAEKSWPNDFEMQVHQVEKQRRSVIQLKKDPPNDIPSDKYETIRLSAQREWPIDFEMQAHTINKQVESYRRLLRM
jgi:hypothetical protein